MMLEESKKDSYQLSKQFFTHKNAVRCIDIYQDQTIITGSLDKSCQIYEKQNNQFTGNANPLYFGTGFIYSVKVFEGGFIVASQDKVIYILDKQYQLIKTLDGHNGPVNSLAYIEGKVISGSWDGTVKIWDLQKGQCIKTLEGHKHAVCVCLLSTGLLLTGSSDKIIRFWEIQSKYQQVKIIAGAHNDVIRDISEIDEFGFVSCSNDETAKIWTYDGEEVQVLRGHQSFIYCVRSIEFGKYITCSEDNTLKIWEGETCIQSITHPGTIWCLQLNRINGNILTGCSDNALRIFSQNKDEWALESEREIFENAGKVTESEQKGQQLTREQLQSMPTVAQMNQYQGKQDGEIRMFRSGDQPGAYCWKQATRSWDLVGEVLNTIPAKQYAGDKYFSAGDYDYVFDVEDESGFMKKLPFNDGDNPLEVAEKYCAREGMSKYYVSQICQFIKQNTKSQGKVNWEKYDKNVSQQGQIKIKEQYKFFPMREFQFYAKGNMDGMQKKILEFNEELKINNAQLALSENNIIYMKNMCENFKNEESYNKDIIGHSELSVLGKLLAWPREKFLPVLDLLRVFSVHFQAEKLFKGVTGGQNIFIEISGILQSSKESEIIKNLCLKVLCNQFKNIGNQTALIGNWQLVMDGISSIISMDNKGANLCDTLTFLLINISILIRDNIREKNKIQQVCKFCANQLVKESLAKNILKIFIAIGNMIMAEEIRDIVIQNLKTEIANLNINDIQGEQNEISDIKECLQDFNDFF